MTLQSGLFGWTVVWLLVQDQLHGSKGIFVRCVNTVDLDWWHLRKGVGPDSTEFQLAIQVLRVDDSLRACEEVLEVPRLLIVASAMQHNDTTLTELGEPLLRSPARNGAVVQLALLPRHAILVKSLAHRDTALLVVADIAIPDGFAFGVGRCDLAGTHVLSLLALVRPVLELKIDRKRLVFKQSILARIDLAGGSIAHARFVGRMERGGWTWSMGKTIWWRPVE